MRTKSRHITAVLGTAAIIVATLALEFDIKALDADKNEGNSEAPLAEFTAVAVGAAHTVFLRTDGSAVAWGSNSFGETDVPNGLKDMTAIAAKSSRTVALKTDGSVDAWGSCWGNLGESFRVIPGRLADRLPQLETVRWRLSGIGEGKGGEE